MGLWWEFGVLHRQMGRTEGKGSRSVSVLSLIWERVELFENALGTLKMEGGAETRGGDDVLLDRGESPTVLIHQAGLAHLHRQW